jgi:hypothetical protein
VVRREAPVLTRRTLLAIVALAAVLVAASLLASLVPEPHSDAGVRLRLYGSHALWFTLLLALVALLVRGWSMSRLRLALALVALAALAIAGNALGWFAAVDPVKVAFGALAGAAFSRALERPWWLLPIGLLVPIADAWSVFSERGVTHEVVDRAAENPEWILWPTIATPIAGFPYESFGRIGIVDILFAGLFLGAAARWRWPAWRGVVAIALGLVLTSLLVFESTGIAVPALPMICVAGLLAYAPQLVSDGRSAWRGRAASQPPSPDSFTE